MALSSLCHCTPEDRCGALSSSSRPVAKSKEKSRNSSEAEAELFRRRSHARIKPMQKAPWKKEAKAKGKEEIEVNFWGSGLRAAVVGSVLERIGSLDRGKQVPDGR